MSRNAYWLSVLSALAFVVLVVELLRRRYLRGKYAVLWLVLALPITAFALFPGLLRAASKAVGIEVPVNLLFFAGLMLMLMLIMQLSYESGRLEEETRTLAEEIGLLRLEVDSLRDDRSR